MNLPLSLHTRVALLGALMTIAIMAVNIQEVAAVVEGVVADNIDVPLDTEIRILALSIDREGRLDNQRITPFPDLASPPSGWGWTVASPAGRWSAGVRPAQIEYPEPQPHLRNGIHSGRGTATSGEIIHVRRLDLVRTGGHVTIIAMSPRLLIDRELNRVMTNMQREMIEVFLVLLLAAILQVRVGLQPLRRLVRDVAKVRSGEAQSVPTPQPPDLQPLASEINAVIARNNAGLEAARVNAANLAHSVKTPLATLLLQLEHEGASAEARDLVAHVSERVGQHLRRARSAAVGMGARARTDVGPVVAQAIGVVERVPWPQPVRFDIRVEPGCTASVEGEDLSEMIGNLVENACRHGGGEVIITATPHDTRIRIAIEDSGQGIPEDAQGVAIKPGVRLDESGEGYGLGLAIVHELATMNGGALSLSRSARLGGLCAELDLPGK